MDLSPGESLVPSDTPLPIDANSVLAFELICQEDRHISTGDLSFFLPSDPLLVSGHCEGQGYWTLSGNSNPSVGGSEGQPGHR